MKRKIEHHLDGTVNVLEFDMNKCQLIDTEAVIFLYHWKNSGRELSLVNPPDILFELLDVLEIKDQWNSLEQ